MSSLDRGAAIPPKALFYDDRGSTPKTPEPSAPGIETQLHSPPRPARLRLKRRHVSHMNAPTQHFLASVAAADMPIPSIEADIAPVDQATIDNLAGLHVIDLDGAEIYQHLNARAFSPPKTPGIEFAPSPSATKFPDWSIDSAWSSSDIESSPEYESSRPSTAISTQTSASLFSQYSHVTDDDDCQSPELEKAEFPTLDLQIGVDAPRKGKRRKAPWTKAMSSHLWSTYLLYLQDPKVTPVRFGKSCIPPGGVCLRVAREAKRSWKGSNTKSGSSTPTAESSKPYIQWPHTCAATRAHLRELCKLKATNRAGRYMSHSPTPFYKAAHRRWNRRSTPARSPSIFSAHDMAMSLVLSTSDSMQPEGPLAQLTRSESEGFPELTTETESTVATTEEVPSMDRSQPLSTFESKTYGPSSSSSSLGAGISLPKQSNTFGPRRSLKSPVRLTRSRSGTQKRRSTKGLEELSRRRPSIAAAFWKESTENAQNQLQVQQPDHQPGPGLAGLDQSDDVFTPKTLFDESPALSASQPQSSRPWTLSGSSSLADHAPPPRLGSPFSGSGSSHSFPNRLSAPINFNLTALRRPFATMQQSSQTNSEAPPARPTLASRIAYIDQRLKELRNRGSERRRSQSPL
ncbi:hypothetical protein F4779DRAFT_403265 [Xylariaceae sp. FL0662B]|nr:hypothetical protein F4779DRAFT_403265 [Xylariaceae sp. FL0662B]